MDLIGWNSQSQESAFLPEPRDETEIINVNTAFPWLVQFYTLGKSNSHFSPDPSCLRMLLFAVIPSPICRCVVALKRTFFPFRYVPNCRAEPILIRVELAWWLRLISVWLWVPHCSLQPCSGYHAPSIFPLLVRRSKIPHRKIAWEKIGRKCA